ncbi:hypothetical protein [Lacrimispora sp.]|jgi:hypothetical protein|uniref:hypothetical protein n=1 Tax=Lacrimispora sp. TaxID=2719234 RepID=UPI00289A35E0|nr:hypothetical protein [Lacrimispora sp.]
MQTTPNLGLKKPETSEYISISDFNDNADIIDATMITKVTATSGDISETVVNTLEPFETKFPMPAAGETIKRFLGKVLTFLKNIKPLEADVTYYVATTGSDTTGDGTNAKPYKTIQKAINTLPKALGAHTASIYVAGGTYDEDVYISGFYSGTGRIMVYLSGNVVIHGLIVSGSHVIINSSDSVLHNLTARYLLVQDTATLNIWAQTNLTTTGYVIDQLTTAAKASIVATRNSTLYLSGVTTVTGNSDTGVFAGNMSQVYIASITGSGLAVGVYSVTGSHVGIISNLISAVTPYSQVNCGSFTYGNGTQISGQISSGLSCTWGTIKGGYVRHGNMIGPAMVTISIEVVTTASLTQGTDYAVDGFPVPIGVSVVVSNNIFGDCFVDGGTSRLRLRMPSNVASGAHLVFTATYITNS